jgi:hypothetical protein
MNKIALTLAALLVAASTAFAGSDHYGSSNQPVAVDHSVTASISKSTVQATAQIGADRNLFGR